MDKIKNYVDDWRTRKEEYFWLDLLYRNPNISYPSHLIIRCRQGIRCNVTDDSEWIHLRTKIFTGTKGVAQVISDLDGQNYEDFTAKDGGKLTMVFKKDLATLTVQQLQELILGIEKLLTKTLPEYVVA